MGTLARSAPVMLWWILAVSAAATPPELPIMSPLVAHTETNRTAFALPMAELDASAHRAFGLGNRTFNLVWSVAPSSIPDADGLGPTFVQRSCAACHVRDGRSTLPHAGAPIDQAVLLLDPIDSRDRAWLRSRFGDKLQIAAIPGVRKEATALVQWHDVADSRGTLRRPEITIEQARFRGVAARATVSPRVAPAVMGLGLLEAVPVAMLAERADPMDRDGDGVRGRLNWLDAEQSVLGRFGWKAERATLRDQVLIAAIDDLGLTSDRFPDARCPPKQRDCRKAAVSSLVDLDDRFVVSIVDYLRLLAVPAPRTSADPQALSGRDVFFRIGCETCHRERLVTDATPAHEVLRDRVVTPYTDLLLHDLGSGLSESGGDPATRNLWRTPPLWGIGLQQQVNGHLDLLHDGRARGIDEAIRWHAGEAERSAVQYGQLHELEREALIEFIMSL